MLTCNEQKSSRELYEEVQAKELQFFQLDIDPIDAVRTMLAHLHEQKARLVNEQNKIDEELRKTQDGIAVLAEQTVGARVGSKQIKLADLITLEHLASKGIIHTRWRKECLYFSTNQYQFYQSTI